MTARPARGEGQGHPLPMPHRFLRSLAVCWSSRSSLLLCPIRYRCSPAAAGHCSGLALRFPPAPQPLRRIGPARAAGAAAGIILVSVDSTGADVPMQMRHGPQSVLQLALPIVAILDPGHISPNLVARGGKLRARPDRERIVFGAARLMKRISSASTPRFRASARGPRSHEATSACVQGPPGGHDATSARASTGCRKVRRSLITWTSEADTTASRSRATKARH